MKHTNFKRLLTAALLLCFIAVLLSGCTQEEGPSTSAPASSGDKAVTLRVVIEDSLYNYVQTMQRSFSLANENVEIVIERIPEKEGREEILHPSHFRC